MTDGKPQVPGWMVSFGDMMTLILTFFILLVSMSKERQAGLVAKGIGSFLIALRSYGLPGVLDKSEQAEIFEGVRRRFNLPPEDDPERRADPLEASNLELIRATVARGLSPHSELSQPAIAAFGPDSDALSDSAREFLDLVAPTLRPTKGTVLLIEGHADDAGPAHRGDDRWLAFRRARAVSDYLVREHGFPTERVQARAWLTELESEDHTTRTVDARLIRPVAPDGSR